MYASIVYWSPESRRPTNLFWCMANGQQSILRTLIYLISFVHKLEKLSNKKEPTCSCLSGFRVRTNPDAKYDFQQWTNVAGSYNAHKAISS